MYGGGGGGGGNEYDGGGGSNFGHVSRAGGGRITEQVIPTVFVFRLLTEYFIVQWLTLEDGCVWGRRRWRWRNRIWRRWWN